MTAGKEDSNMIQISPSLLAADFSRLAAEIQDIDQGGADMIHLDVMDGVFVPNISFGFPVIEALRPLTACIFDVHLMIVEPERYIDRFAKAGADIITFHLEATKDPLAVLRAIHKSGARAGISIKPMTPPEAVFPYLPFCDMVLVMSVEPGFGGQSFIPSSPDRVRAVRNEIARLGLSVDVQVDGGINEQTARLCVAAGANVLVAGSSVFRASDRRAAMDALRN